MAKILEVFASVVASTWQALPVFKSLSVWKRYICIVSRNTLSFSFSLSCRKNRAGSIFSPNVTVHCLLFISKCIFAPVIEGCCLQNLSLALTRTTWVYHTGTATLSFLCWSAGVFTKELSLRLRCTRTVVFPCSWCDYQPFCSQHCISR